MKFKITLSLLLAMTAIAATAATISESLARQIASQFMNSRGKDATALRTITRASASATAPLYTFDNTGGGYVVVSGDDRTAAVLAYSDHGTLDDASPALQEWLDGYAAQIAALDQGAKPAHLTPRTAVAPMLKTHWGQGSPYNNKLPWVSGNRAVTGCVATTMAQIMAYHQWPAKPTATIPAYTTSTNSIYMPALSPVNFNWAAMNDTYYQGDTTTTAGQAVATLMLYCAQSVNMNFLKSSSSASTGKIPSAMATYFGYKSSARYIRRNNYTNDDWEQLMHDELTAGRPIAYAGNKKSGGHAFVCDGCDDQGRFHINWGWGSQSDGYFVMSVLSPGAEGIGSAGGAYGYVYDQAMAVGIEPGTEASSPILTATGLTINSSTTTRTSTSAKFSVNASCSFYNYTTAATSFDYGWALYDEAGTLVKQLQNSYTIDLKVCNYVSSTRTLTFGDGINTGTYYIKPNCSVYLKNDWMPCAGSDLNYIKVVINGLNCTVTGYGKAAEPTYVVNDVAFEGTMRSGKPVNMTVNVTNNGDSRNDLIYLFVDGEWVSSALATIEKGEQCDLSYRYTPTAAGTYTLTFTLDADGAQPIATRTLTIDAMPATTLTATTQVLDVTDEEGRIITGNRFAVTATVENTGSIDYDDEIAMRLYRVTNEENVTGVNIHTKSIPLQLAAGESTTVTFEFTDDLIDGLKYFAWLYYYNNEGLKSIVGTKAYTVNLQGTNPDPGPGPDPDPDPNKFGDLNGDGKVDIIDVNILINIILTEE